MQIVTTNYAIADYCNLMQRGEVVVNNEYQRSDQVWPSIARSFLIETILMNFPIPKLYLYQVTDLKSRTTFKEIVDGQQRSTAIRDFFEGNLRLSKTLELEEAAGRTYDELEPEMQRIFLRYGLSCDLFVAATPEEVREVFRRMNLFTVPLNPEEQRHAIYQGKFKWFIHKLARRYDDAFNRMGLFGAKQLVRMADTKLLTEIAHAYINGIRTTKREQLDQLYESRDEHFPEEAQLERRMTAAFDHLITWSELHDTSLMKPHIIYSLVLAIMHVTNPVKSLARLFKVEQGLKLDRTTLIANLTALAQAFEDPEDAGRLSGFAEASTERTNVGEQRAARFRWFCRALSRRHL